ncbi:hypothetical protein [Nocardia jejuensis]|uniref:hypothetical protein n=1 Tax=Nocardia jejuensis TaxID=328049 RepID=UPI000A841B37|nr:hypothetical protein [Nocardia jejuensis]
MEIILAIAPLAPAAALAGLDIRRRNVDMRASRLTVADVRARLASEATVANTPIHRGW